MGTREATALFRPGRRRNGPYVMAQLSQIGIATWIALYVATRLCCAIETALSVAAADVQIARERAGNDLRTARSAAPVIPKTWCRWQKLYLTSLPVTLAMIVAFALTLRWTRHPSEVQRGYKPRLYRLLLNFSR